MRTAPILRVAIITIFLTAACTTSCHRRGHSSTSTVAPGAPIDATAPGLALYHPTASALGVPTNSSLFLQFTENMDQATLNANSIQLANNAGAIAVSLQTIAANAVILTPLTELDANASYTVTVSSSALDTAGNAFPGPFSWSFTTGASVDLIAPTVSLTIPSNGDMSVPYNLAAITIVFSEAMNPASIGPAAIVLLAGSTPIPGIASAVGTSVASFMPAAPLSAFTSYTVTVAPSVADLSGNVLGSAFAFSFTTGTGPDSVAPTVVLTNPEGGMSGIPVNTAGISVAFSEAMDGVTINTSTFTVELGSLPIPGTVLFSGTTAAVFAPLGNLSPSSTYTAKVSAGAKDLAGNALAGPFLWTFTTGLGPDLTPPALVFSTPASLETGVSLNASISASLSESIDPTSVNPSSFQLKKGTTPLTGAVSLSGNSLAQFAPGAPFSILGRYTASLTAGIKDLSGNALAPTSWDFTARDGNWLTAGTLGANPANAKFDLGMDGAGHAIAIWQRDDGPAIDDHIFARRFDAGTAVWSAPVQLDSAPTSAISPRLAMNATGNAFALWEQNDGTPNYRVVARRYDAGTQSWGAQIVLFTNSLSTRACAPQIAIDAAGNAFAGWIGSNVAGQLSQYLARYDAGSASWGTGVLMESATDPVTMFRIVANGAGDALLVFAQGPGSTAKNLYARRYLASGASWGAATLLDTGAGAVSAPTVAMDPAGNGIVLWVQNNAGFACYAHRFDAGSSSWQGETLLDTGGVAAIPSIAMDSTGNALAAWESGTPLTFVKARRYDKLAASWSALTTLSDNSGNSSTPCVALDPDGNGLVLWSQRDGVQNNIVGLRYVAANASFGPVSFVENAPRTASNPLILLGGPQSKGVAIWKQLNATLSDLWANRFE